MEQDDWLGAHVFRTFGPQSYFFCKARADNVLMLGAAVRIQGHCYAVGGNQIKNHMFYFTSYLFSLSKNLRFFRRARYESYIYIITYI